MMCWSSVGNNRNVIIISLAFVFVRFGAPVQASLPFTYLNETTELGYGLQDWDKVESDQFYFNWERYDTKLNDGSHDNDLVNACRWRVEGSERHRQSPVDIDTSEADSCTREDDDQHRWWTEEGNCKLRDWTFDIKPWGLFMTFPMSGGRSNPSDDPCVKPNLDSSGGFGDRWFMNHMTIKTPSEHTIDGKQYDAEINFAHFQYRRKENLALIISVLVEAKDEYPDNPVFEPYVQKWLDVKEDIEEECETLAPTVTTAPTPTPLPFVEKTLSSANDVNEDDIKGFNGIMFDVRSSSKKDMNIESFCFNLYQDDGDDEAYMFELYAKQGTHVGDVRKKEEWTSLGKYVSRPMIMNNYYDDDKDDSDDKERMKQSIMLMQPYTVPAGETVAFYLVHTDRNERHIRGIEYGRNERGKEQVYNDDLSLMVGTAINGGAFERRSQVSRGTTFIGTIHYIIESEATPVVVETNDTNDDEQSENDNCDVESHVVEVPVGAIDDATMEGVVPSQRMLFDISASGIEKDIYVSSFGLYLNHNAVEKGDTTTPLQVYATQGSVDTVDTSVLNEDVWTNLGTYNVVSLGPQITTTLELNEVVIIPSNTTMTFYIIEMDDEYDLLGGSDGEHSDKHTTDASDYYVDVHSSSQNEENTNMTITDQDEQNEENMNMTITDQDEQNEENMNITSTDQDEDDTNEEDGMVTTIGVSKERSSTGATVTSFAGAVHYNICPPKAPSENNSSSARATKEGDDDDDDRRRQLLRGKQQQQRKLDHRKDGSPDRIQNWDLSPYNDPYRLLPSPWFYVYTGSFTMPMCYQGAYWRIVDTPLHISKRQLDIISDIIASSKDKDTCEPNTVGRPLNEDGTKVDVSRPTQTFFKNRHGLQYCGPHSWKSQRFYNTVRGNTCWELLTNDSLCFVDGYGNPEDPPN